MNLALFIPPWLHPLLLTTGVLTDVRYGERLTQAEHAAQTSRHHEDRKNDTPLEDAA